MDLWRRWIPFKTPSEAIIMLTEDEMFARIYEYLYEFFEGDDYKINLWLKTNNPLLGNVCPLFMIAVGRSKKLLKFIEDCIEGNRP